MVAVHRIGNGYVIRRTEGDVIRLMDANGDGKYESFVSVAEHPSMHGIAFDGDTVCLVTVNDIYTAPVNADGSFGALTRIVDDLPDGGQHPNCTLAIGPDDRLYVTVGSTCNACAETNPESATIPRANKDGKIRTIFASSLRNTIGFGCQPQTGKLYGADHGIDWLGNEEQQEELNLIEQGKQYSWPYVYDFSRFNPQDNPPEGLTLEQWAQRSKEPKLGYTAHSAPMQMTFYTGSSFPEAYHSGAVVLGLNIELLQLSVYDVGKLGQRFDIVLFMGVLFHLQYPLLAVDLLHEHVVGDLLVFQSTRRGSELVADTAENTRSRRQRSSNSQVGRARISLSTAMPMIRPIGGSPIAPAAKPCCARRASSSKPARKRRSFSVAGLRQPLSTTWSIQQEAQPADDRFRNDLDRANNKSHWDLKAAWVRVGEMAVLACQAIAA